MFKKLYVYIRYHLWEWKHRKKVSKIFAETSQLLELGLMDATIGEDKAFITILYLIKDSCSLNMYYRPESLSFLVSVSFKGPKGKTYDAWAEIPCEEWEGATIKRKVVKQLFEDCVWTMMNKYSPSDFTNVKYSEVTEK